MASSPDIDTPKVWNAYYDKFGYEPTDASHLQKFTKSSAGKHVETLSFKQAQTVYKLHKGKGKITLSPTPKITKKRNSALLKKQKKNKSHSRPTTPNSPTLTPQSHKKRKSKSNKSKSKSPKPKPPNLKKNVSTHSNPSQQLSPPSKTHKKKHKKNASNISRKKRKSNTKSKSNKTKKETEIRSTLNNNALHPSLESILEILRRATLVKKQKKLYEREQKEFMEQKERVLKEAQERERERQRQILAQDSHTSQNNDLTLTDISEYQNKNMGTRKETEQLFQTETAVDDNGGSYVTNINPLLLAGIGKNYTDSSEDEIETSLNGQTMSLGVIDDVKESFDVISESGSLSVETEELGYETPPELFRNDAEWDWSERDIVWEGSLNYGISLQLLHLGLSNGPLFPNSVLRWKRLEFKENGPPARSGHVCEFVDGKMVIFGGYCEQMLTDHIFLVHLNDNLGKDNGKLEVTPISSLEKIHKTYRVGHSGVSLSHNNCLYLFGGWNDQKYVNHGLLFNVDSLKLVVEQTKDRILPSPRRDHTLVKMGSSGSSCFLLFGGWSHDYDGNELWLLGSNWKWQQLTVTGTPPCPRRGHSANVIGAHMYVFGGLYGFSKYLNDLHIYNGDSSEWIQPELVGVHRPTQRAWHTSNTIGTQILIFGGTMGRGNFMSDLWVFDTIGHFWFEIDVFGKSPLPRCSHTMVRVQCDKGFMSEPFLGECIKESDGKEVRLGFVMFGGLCAMESKGKEEINESESGKKKGKKKVKKKVKKKGKNGGLMSELKADISKQQKRESKVVLVEEVKEESVFSSDSEREEDMEPVNTIELSDDLYVLMLEI